ncbi:hypothetical protein EVAR_38116_1 [Eumeta japonica]|uniref:Uncharacterized protein n=1 Tax=Eumeta variegata TaxID=151549 RepID=A0A4C1X8S4_EUMVA|nr:hypothetical protein EVAR_38116_1 [Eumeta japonica]
MKEEGQGGFGLGEPIRFRRTDTAVCFKLSFECREHVPADDLISDVMPHVHDRTQCNLNHAVQAEKWQEEINGAAESDFHAKSERAMGCSLVTSGGRGRDGALPKQTFRNL